MIGACVLAAAMLIGVAACEPAHKRVDGDAIAAGAPEGDWLAYGRTYSEQRFSPLDQINDKTIGRLAPEWSMELPDGRSLVSTPLVVDGVLYFTTAWSIVHALDAVTGELLWNYDPKTIEVMAKNPERLKISWGTNRGVAFWKGKVYVGTTDGRLIALFAKTGALAWSVQTFNPGESRMLTGYPLAFNGKIIIGHGGADFGATRGFATAYDAETGRQVWRFYAVPGDPSKGFENKAMEMAAKTWTGEWWKFGGGGTIWNSMTYDPELNRVYLGTGNGQPWNRKVRSPGGGDNLFLCSVVAVDADTGEYVWHYQTNPGETWDYNSNMDMVLADLQIDGKPRKVLMHAPKNGFFYVIDRETGKLISAEKIAKVTWAERIDLTTGRPVELPGKRLESGESEFWPGVAGAHSWPPMSFNASTGLVYIPVIEVGGYLSDKSIDHAKWRSIEFSLTSTGMDVEAGDLPVEGTSSSLLAWDPVRQKQTWRIPLPGVWNGGTVTTRGNLVFQGRIDGTLVAYDARDGRELWKFAAGRAITAPPISYAIDGRQYITVLVGGGGGYIQEGATPTAQFAWDFRAPGRRIVTFALDGKAEVPETPRAPVVPVDIPELKIDHESVERGGVLYGGNCTTCHGAAVRSGGAAPDLRASAMASTLGGLKSVILDGALLQRGMPKFVNLKDDDAEALYHYIRSEARASLHAGANAEGRQ